MKIAIIDSGVHAAHPHVGGVAGGVWITEAGCEPDYVDRLGHGTAVTAVIREKAPEADVYAVKVFDRTLATTGAVLLRALDWCLDAGMDFVNLSLGTGNPRYSEDFEQRSERAARQGTQIVAAYEMRPGRAAYPGSLAGVVGVVLAQQCDRDDIQRQERDGRTLYAASGFPRSIPGVPRTRNLQGISFAVARVTGALAAARLQSDIACAGR